MALACYMWLVFYCFLEIVFLVYTASQDFARPILLLPLNRKYGTRDMSKNGLTVKATDVALSQGPKGEENGAYEFFGNSSSFIEIPQQSKMDTRLSMSFFTWIYNLRVGGTPLINYGPDNPKYAVHLYLQYYFQSTTYFQVSLVYRDLSSTTILQHPIPLNNWTWVGFTYDHLSGKFKLYINGVVKEETTTPKKELATNHKIKIGGPKQIIGSSAAFRGRLSCLQIYNTALTESQVEDTQRYCTDIMDIYRPCGHYNHINTNSRRLSTSQVENQPSDKALSLSKWYRLTGNKILSYCPISTSCGTQTPGWLNGIFPSRKDGIRKMTLCYRKDSNCCSFKVDVLVRQCYGHSAIKLYELPPQGRFCTETVPNVGDVMFKSTNQRCLFGHVFYSEDNIREVNQCSDRCLNSGSICKSFNYINEDNGKCQLNNATITDGQSRDDKNCSYYELV